METTKRSCVKGRFTKIKGSMRCQREIEGLLPVPFCIKKILSVRLQNLVVFEPLEILQRHLENCLIAHVTHISYFHPNMNIMRAL